MLVPSDGLQGLKESLAGQVLRHGPVTGAAIEVGINHTAVAVVECAKGGAITRASARYEGTPHRRAAPMPGADGDSTAVLSLIVECSSWPP